MSNRYNDFFVSENLRIEFLNFGPNPKDKKRLRSLLDRIEESSPSNSLIEVQFKKEEEAVIGSIQIFSQKKNFKEESSDKEMSSLIEKLITSLNSKIDDWKKHRFSKIDEVLA